MKTKILNLLKEKGSGRSFVELSKIDGFTGNNNFEIEDKKIILWQNISSEAINAITELIEEKKIEMVSTSTLVYHADGKILTFPIAKQFRRYQKLRWFPAAFNKGPKF